MLTLAALARGLEPDVPDRDEAIQQTVEGCLGASEGDPERWIEGYGPRIVAAHIPHGKGLFTESTRKNARRAIARSVSKGQMTVTSANEEMALLKDFRYSDREQIEFKSYAGLAANPDFKVTYDRALVMAQDDEVAEDVALSLGLNMMAWQLDDTYDRKEEGPSDNEHVSLGVLEEGVYVPVTTVLSGSHPVRKLIEASAQS